MPTLIQRHYSSQNNASEPESIAATDANKSTPTIMIVDDSVTVRKVTARFLKREGFTVVTARDGAEALRVIQDQQPDLMLLDVEMPRMDGFELLSLLRSSDKFAALAVIMISSRTAEKHQQRGISLGAQAYFGKPYNEDELLQKINQLLVKPKLR